MAPANLRWRAGETARGNVNRGQRYCPLPRCVEYEIGFETGIGHQRVRKPRELILAAEPGTNPSANQSDHQTGTARLPCEHVASHAGMFAGKKLAPQHEGE